MKTHTHASARRKYMLCTSDLVCWTHIQMDRQAGRNCGSVSLQCAQLNSFNFWQISYRMTWDLDVNRHGCCDGYKYALVSEWSWYNYTTWTILSYPGPKSFHLWCQRDSLPKSNITIRFSSRCPDTDVYIQVTRTFTRCGEFNRSKRMKSADVTESTKSTDGGARCGRVGQQNLTR